MAPRRDKYGFDSYWLNLALWWGLGVVLPVAFMVSFPIRNDLGRGAPLSRYLSRTDEAAEFTAAWIIPFTLLWSEEAARINVVNGTNRAKMVYYGSLLSITLSFLGLVIVHTGRTGTGHTVFGFLFSMSSFAHFVIIVLIDRTRIVETVILITGAPIFLAVAITAVVPGNYPAYFFFTIELISLVYLLIMTPVHVYVSRPLRANLGLSPKRVQQLEELFHEYDPDDTGYASLSDVKKAFQKKGVLADNEEMKKVFEMMDIDGSKYISFAEFVEFQKSVLIERGPLIEPAALVPSSYLTKAQSDGLEVARRNLGRLMPGSASAGADPTAKASSDFKHPSNLVIGVVEGRYGPNEDLEEKRTVYPQLT